MANYQDDNNCKVCGESLDTENEKDMGEHEGCASIDLVSGVQLDPLRFSPAWWEREALEFEAERNRQMADGSYCRYPGYGGLRGG